MSYAVRYDPTTGRVLGVSDPDGRCVPADPGNRDWQAFLAWNAQQQTLLDVTTPVVDMPTARAASFAALDEWLAAKEAAGVVAGSYTLPATEVAQRRFTSLAAMCQLAGSAVTTVPIKDQAGVTHTLATADFFTLMVGYGSAVQTLMFGTGGYFPLAGQIEAAQSVADLNAISFS